MPENLLSYQGNAGLGLGSNPNIPAIGKEDFDNIEQAARDISLQDNQWNVLKYQQKQKDQAAFREAVDNGQISQGEILPEYQPVFDAAKKRVTDFYQKNGDKLISDPNLYRQYQTLITDAKDVATHAQVNTNTIKRLQKQKADETIPFKQAQIQKHIDAQINGTKSDFWNQAQEYQKLHELNIADISGVSPAAIVKTVRQDPNNPLTSYDRSVVDYDQILKEKYNDFVNDTTGEKADSQSKFYQKMQDKPVLELGQTLNSMDAQIDRYNKARGFKEGMPGFVSPIKRAAVGGRLLIQESIPDFTAKYALTSQPQFVNEVAKTDYKLGTLQVAQQRADTDAAYKRIMAGNSSQRVRLYGEHLRQQAAKAKSPAEQDDFHNEMYNKILTEQPSLITGDGKGKFHFSKIPYDGSLPVYTFDGKNSVLLPPVGGSIINKKQVGGEYTPQYKIDGKPLSQQDLVNIYVPYKEGMGKDWNGSLDDFLKMMIQKKRIDFSIKGQGIVDRKLNTAAQRVITNKNTKKGQEGIFEPEADEQIPDTVNPIEE